MPRDNDRNNVERSSRRTSKKKKVKNKRKVFTKRMRDRLKFGMLIFCVLFCVILGKVIYFNIAKRDEYNEALLGHKGITSKPVPYKRGDIYDCNGSVLATSTMMYNLIIEPANITENKYTIEPTVKALNKYFNVPEEETYKYLEDKDSYYNVIRKKLTYDDVKAYLTDSRDPELKKENLKYVVGIQLEIEYKRTYPNNELGCHMLGFVIGGNEGLGGIEGGYNSYLNGQNGRNYSYLGEGDNLVHNDAVAHSGDPRAPCERGLDREDGNVSRKVRLLVEGERKRGRVAHGRAKDVISAFRPLHPVCGGERGAGLRLEHAHEHLAPSVRRAGYLRLAVLVRLHGRLGKRGLELLALPGVEAVVCADARVVAVYALELHV